jgi:molybdopterin-guanine dinucleotide biosynthesis protein A
MPAPDRLATIAAAVLVGTDPNADPGVESASRTAELLTRLFEDVMWVGAPPPREAPGRQVDPTEGPGLLGGLASALHAARAPRVLVLGDGLPRPSTALCLALVAWPEADVVTPRVTRAGLLLALYRRAPTLDCARRLLANGRSDPSELHGALECQFLEAEDVACVDPDAAAPASRVTEGLAH